MPFWLQITIKAIFAVLLGTWFLLQAVGGIRKLLIEQIRPIWYSESEKTRAELRRRFARFVVSELNRISRLEALEAEQPNEGSALDKPVSRFAELEAEVETHGRRNSFWFPHPLDRIFAQNHPSDLRREKSLSRALQKTKERRILLEGDPGSGKSVTLRYLALKLARKAEKGKNSDTIVPIYVDLKRLKRQRGEAIDRALIERFVKETLKRINAGAVDDFLESEFSKGLERGSWLFLFDSFDEIPEVLTSIEADEAIRKYSEAIDDFLSGMNQCRGIVASRRFRGPKHLDWPRFRILPLKQKRIVHMIRQFGLSKDAENGLRSSLATAPDDIRAMVANPLFLSIICRQARDRQPFPTNGYGVMDSYLKNRLERDSERLRARYGLRPEALEKAARKIAFAMSSTDGLGLSPEKPSLLDAIKNAGLGGSTRFLEKSIGALELIHLARLDPHISKEQGPSTFAFAHRRFQEYFATGYLLEDTGRVPPKDLLTNGLWRETSVVLFQTRPIATLEPLLKEAGASIADACLSLGLDPADQLSEAEEGWDRKRLLAEGKLKHDFRWPKGFLHLASLLQDGFRGRRKDLPAEVSSQTARILGQAIREGTEVDRKWALEVSGLLPTTVARSMLEWVFNDASDRLKKVAFRQTHYFGQIPPDFLVPMRMLLIKRAILGKLKEERFAYQSILDSQEEGTLALTLRVLLWLPFIYTLAFGLSSIWTTWLYFSDRTGTAPEKLFVLVVMLIAGSLALRATLSGPSGKDRSEILGITGSVEVAGIVGLWVVGLFVACFPAFSAGLPREPRLLWPGIIIAAFVGCLAQLRTGIHHLPAMLLGPAYPTKYLIMGMKLYWRKLFWPFLRLSLVALFPFIAVVLAGKVIENLAFWLMDLLDARRAVHGGLAKIGAWIEKYLIGFAWTWLLALVAILFIYTVFLRLRDRKRVRAFLEKTPSTIELLEAFAELSSYGRKELIRNGMAALAPNGEWADVFSDLQLARDYESLRNAHHNLDSPFSFQAWWQIANPHLVPKPPEVNEKVPPPFRSETFAQWYKVKGGSKFFRYWTPEELDLLAEWQERIELRS